MSDRVSVQFELTEKANYRINITDQTGRILRSMAEKTDALPGSYQEDIVVGDLPTGKYYIEVQTSPGIKLFGQFVKLKP